MQHLLNGCEGCVLDALYTLRALRNVILQLAGTPGGPAQQCWHAWQARRFRLPSVWCMVAAACHFNTHQRTDGRFLIGETQPSEFSNTDTSDSNAARILALAAAAVPALSGAVVEGMHVGYRCGCRPGVTVNSFWLDTSNSVTVYCAWAPE